MSFSGAQRTASTALIALMNWAQKQALSGGSLQCYELRILKR